MGFAELANVVAGGEVARRKGAQQAVEQQRASKFQDLALEEKQRAAAIDQRYKEAQIGEAQARAQSLLNPQPKAETPINWQTEAVEAPGGPILSQIDPRTGKTRSVLGADGKPLRPVKKDSSAADARQAGQNFKQEQSLVDDYRNEVKEKRDTHQKLSLAIRNVPRAKAGDGAAQVEMLYSFISALDPGTAVKEGEIQLARQATPLWDWAMSNVSKVENKSAIVPPEMIDKMATLMAQRASGIEQQVGTTRDQYLGMAKRYQIENPDALFRPLGATRDRAGANGSDTAPAAGAKTITVNGKTFQLPE